MRVLKSRLLGLVIVVVLAGSSVTPSAAQGSQEEALALVAALEEAGLLTEIGMTQTVADTTITLDWAYANEHQVMFRFEYFTPTDIYNAPDGEFYYVPWVDFRGSNGENYSSLTMWRGRIDRPDGLISWEGVYTYDLNTVYVPSTDPARSGEEISNYLAAHYGDQLPDTLSFNVLMGVNAVAELEDAPGYGFDETDTPYTFEFSVPLHRVQRISSQITQVVDDVPLTLTEISLTPVSTLLTVCMAEPSPWRVWHPDVELTFNGAPVSQYSQMVDYWDAGRAQCTTARYALAHDMQPGSLALTVNALRPIDPGTQTYWAAVAAELAASDVVIDVVPDGAWFTYELVSQPDSLSDDDLYTLLYNTRTALLPETISGPWVFEVAFPGAEED